MKEQIGVMISSSEVETRISEMAAAIDKAYEGKTVHLKTKSPCFVDL